MQRDSKARIRRVAIPLLVAGVGLAAGYGFSIGLASYFVYLGTSVVISAITILGLGIVTGSAGMIALCQLTFSAVGAWVVSGLSFVDAPGGFVLWLILGGLAAGVVGILVGLPALRLRGINLAVVTLALAAAADLVLVQLQFPGTESGTFVARPESLSDDRSYFFLSVLVLVVCGLLAHMAQQGRWGSGWRFVAFSERGTAAVGASVPTSKLSAFACSATLGGIGGGLIAGQVGLVFAASFTPIQSLALYVLSIMAGAYLVDMAVFGGLLWIAVPELLKRWGIPQDWGFVVFGALGIQALTSKTNLGAIIREVWWRYRERDVQTSSTLARTPADDTTSRPANTTADEPILTVERLSISFGEVQALDGVTLSLPANSVMGLIGPNGAGKSTLVDILTGFLPQAEGDVALAGRSLRGRSPTQRARTGLRRTFQQDRVPPSLSVDTYVRFVARRRVSADEVAEVLNFFGCPPARTRIAGIDVGTRRLIEVAGHVLSRPAVLLLDEPTAGLSHEEHVGFGNRLRQVPSRFGISVLLIEHDLELVRSVCDTITVLDFGKVIASGGHEEVLDDPDVIKAYMGESEMSS